MAEPDPLEILRVLERHGVRYVLIGAAAARIAGAPVVTEDIDVTPADGPPSYKLVARRLTCFLARISFRQIKRNQWAWIISACSWTSPRSRTSWPTYSKQKWIFFGGRWNGTVALLSMSMIRMVFMLNCG